jgi:hypothetical protein
MDNIQPEVPELMKQKKCLCIEWTTLHPKFLEWMEKR